MGYKIEFVKMENIFEVDVEKNIITINEKIKNKKLAVFTIKEAVDELELNSFMKGNLKMEKLHKYIMRDYSLREEDTLRVERCISCR